MNYVTLNNGVKMSMVGYGVFEIPAEQTARCVFDALETGYRLIDTAQAYYNEKEVGDGIQRGIRELGIRREGIFLTTKVWVTEFGYEKTKASVEESLRKLQTDYLDLVLIHQCLSDYYGAYRALEDLYDEGKIRAIGISNFSAERMADIATFNRIIPAVNQVETHLFWQQYDLHEWMEKLLLHLPALDTLPCQTEGLHFHRLTSNMSDPYDFAPYPLPKNLSTAVLAASGSFCAVSPFMASPSGTDAPIQISLILSAVPAKPLPACVQNGITVFPEKS